jgi:hypothetical protein
MSLTDPLRGAVDDRRRAADAVAVTTLLVATLDLVVPAVLLAGYFVRLLDADRGLPVVDDVAALARTGTGAAALFTLASLPVVAAWGVATLTAPPGGVQWLLADAAAGRLPSGSYLLGSAVAGTALVAGATLSVPCGYVGAVAVTRYAAGGVEGLLALGAFGRTLTDSRNVRAAAVSTVALVACGVAAAAVGLLPLGPLSEFLAAATVGTGSLAAAVLWRTNAVVAPVDETRGGDATRAGDAVNGSFEAADRAAP